MGRMKDKQIEADNAPGGRRERLKQPESNLTEPGDLIVPSIVAEYVRGYIYDLTGRRLEQWRVKCYVVGEFGAMDLRVDIHERNGETGHIEQWTQTVRLSTPARELEIARRVAKRHLREIRTYKNRIK